MNDYEEIYSEESKRSDAEKDSDRLRYEIEATRRRIEARAEDLKASLKPRSISRLQDSLKMGGGRLVESFRDNPVPIALIGAGLGWLVIRDYTASRRPAVDFVPVTEPSAIDNIKESVSGAVDKAKDAVHNAGQKTKDVVHSAGQKVSAGAAKVKDATVHMAQSTRDWFTTTLEQNPLLLAAASMGLGLIAGVAIPPSQAETDTAGKIGEKIVGEVLGKGTDAIEKSEDEAEDKFTAPEPQASSPSSGESAAS